MAFLDFSKTQFIKTVPPIGKIPIGYFKVVTSLNLYHIRLTIYIDGFVPTVEQVRVNIYSDADYSSLIYQSAWANLSDIDMQDKWIGWLRTDFDGENISNQFRYYPEIEVANYAEVVGVSYLGFAYDFPFAIYDNALPNFYQHPIQVQIFGEVERGLR